MKKLCLVTYTRSDEGFTEELDKISNAFYEEYGNNFKVVICCEEKFDYASEIYDIEFMEMGGTKYRRLISLMERDDSQYYLSIDNDITGNINEMIEFVHIMLQEDYEVGWGRIKAKKQKGIIPNLVAVDKLLSHNIIRPFLWKIGAGISIPGQIFCIKGESYRGKLIELDTFLDDLALGLYVNVNKSRKYVISKILGLERPNSRFVELWKQRSRWAIGYATILKATKKEKNYINKVYIHGLSYHMSWLLNWSIIFFLLLYFWPLSILYIWCISILIVRKDFSLILYALLYQVVFPIFHIKWGISMIKELRKGEN